MNKRAVILLGAGATLGWNGRTTKQITQSLIEDKKFLTKNGESLASFIQRKLAEYHGLQNLTEINNDINFEYLINTLESLSEYVYQVAQGGGPPQFVGSKPAWFILREFFDEIRFYTCQGKDGQQGWSNYRNGTDSYETSYEQIHSENCDLHHLLEATKHYMYIIRMHVARYDATYGEERFKQMNDSFCDFYSHLKEKGYVVRFYTTNYDDIVPKIIGRFREPAPFTGFDPPVSDLQRELLPNVKKVLTDCSSDVYYNLHGNIYWDFANHEERAEMTYVFKMGMPQIRNFYTHQEYTNPTESTNVYNIVTGFNKLQKTTMEPLRSFSNAFSIDCINANLLITIGYSYSDPHINKSMKNAVDENNAKFAHVGYSPDGFFGGQPYFNMQRMVLTKKPAHSFLSEGEMWHFYHDESACIYRLGFEEFLKTKSWIRLNV